MTERCRFVKLFYSCYHERANKEMGEIVRWMGKSTSFKKIPMSLLSEEVYYIGWHLYNTSSLYLACFLQ